MVFPGYKTVFALLLPAAFSLAAPQPIAAVGPGRDANGPENRPAIQIRPPASDYPFYMPMQALRAPAVRLLVKCEASRAAGREVYQGRDAATLYGRAEGGYEFVYEAQDAAGRPCVYPFAPWLPQIVGALHGTQYILRSSQPGRQVTFRTADPWATINLRLFNIGRQAIALDRVFAGLVAQGVGIWIGFQSFINMGVNLGALPTKGLTLPLMSYGGSAILVNLVAIAVVLRIDYENRQLMHGGRV